MRPLGIYLLYVVILSGCYRAPTQDEEEDLPNGSETDSISSDSESDSHIDSDTGTGTGKDSDSETCRDVDDDCDGLDDDCDGESDENLAWECPVGEVCFNGECIAVP